MAKPEDNGLKNENDDSLTGFPADSDIEKSARAKKGKGRWSVSPSVSQESEAQDKSAPGPKAAKESETGEGGTSRVSARELISETEALLAQAQALIKSINIQGDQKQNAQSIAQIAKALAAAQSAVENVVDIRVHKADIPPEAYERQSKALAEKEEAQRQEMLRQETQKAEAEREAARVAEAERIRQIAAAERAAERAAEAAKRAVQTSIEEVVSEYDDHPETVASVEKATDLLAETQSLVHKMTQKGQGENAQAPTSAEHPRFAVFDVKTEEGVLPQGEPEDLNKYEIAAIRALKEPPAPVSQVDVPHPPVKAEPRPVAPAAAVDSVDEAEPESLTEIVAFLEREEDLGEAVQPPLFPAALSTSDSVAKEEPEVQKPLEAVPIVPVIQTVPFVSYLMPDEEEPESIDEIILEEAPEKKTGFFRSLFGRKDETAAVAEEEAEAIEPVAVAEEEAEVIEAVVVAEEEAEVVEAVAVAEEEAEVIEPVAVAEEEAEVIEPVAVAEEEAEVIEPVAVAEEEAEVIEPVAVTEEEAEVIEPVAVAEGEAEVIEPVAVAEEEAEVIEAVVVAEEEAEVIEPVAVAEEEAEALSDIGVILEETPAKRPWFSFGRQDKEALSADDEVSDIDNPWEEPAATAQTEPEWNPIHHWRQNFEDDLSAMGVVVDNEAPEEIEPPVLAETPPPVPPLFKGKAGQTEKAVLFGHRSWTGAPDEMAAEEAEEDQLSFSALEEQTEAEAPTVAVEIPVVEEVLEPAIAAETLEEDDAETITRILYEPPAHVVEEVLELMEAPTPSEMEAQEAPLAAEEETAPQPAKGWLGFGQPETDALAEDRPALYRDLAAAQEEQELDALMAEATEELEPVATLEETAKQQALAQEVPEEDLVLEVDEVYIEAVPEEAPAETGFFKSLFGQKDPQDDIFASAPESVPLTTAEEPVAAHLPVVEAVEEPVAVSLPVEAVEELPEAVLRPAEVPPPIAEKQPGFFARLFRKKKKTAPSGAELAAMYASMAAADEERLLDAELAKGDLDEVDEEAEIIESAATAETIEALEEIGPVAVIEEVVEEPEETGPVAVIEEVIEEPEVIEPAAVIEEMIGEPEVIEPVAVMEEVIGEPEVIEPAAVIEETIEPPTKPKKPGLWAGLFGKREKIAEESSRRFGDFAIEADEKEQPEEDWGRDLETGLFTAPDKPEVDSEAAAMAFEVLEQLDTPVEAETSVMAEVEEPEEFEEPEEVRTLAVQRKARSAARTSQKKKAKVRKPSPYGPFTQLYRSTYYLSIQTLRTLHRIGRSVRRTGRQIGAWFDENIGSWNRRRRTAGDAAFNAFWAPFEEMSHNLAVFRKRMKVARSHSFKEAFTVFFESLSYLIESCYKPLGILLDYALPVVGVFVFLFALHIFNSTTFGLEVTYANQPVGYISNEAEFEAAQQQMVDRIVNDASRTTPLDIAPTFKLKVISPSDLTDVDTLTNNMIMAAGGELAEADGLYVDGDFVGATYNGDALLLYMNSMLDRFRTETPNERVSFKKSIELKPGLYPVSSIDEDKLVQTITGEEQVRRYHTVVSGDTPTGIAQKYGVPYAQVKSLNPDIEKRLMIGQQVIVSREMPFLGVQTIRTETYTVPVPYSVVQTYDPNQLQGYAIVKKQGQQGLEELVADVVYEDGEEISRNVVNRTVLKEAVAQEVTTGSKKPTNQIVGSAINPGGFIWPVDGGRVSMPFRGYYGHTGMDIAAPSGTAVRASMAGTVTIAGWHSLYGRYIKIDNGNGVQTLYAHNSALYVVPGQYVQQGELIAAVGRTGNASGNHCHFEIILNGSYVNPANYIGTISPR